MVLDAWKGNPYGHVAYVEAVQDTNHWTISHANMNVGEDFAKLGDVPIRKVVCVSNPDHTVSFKGFRHQFHLLGFLTPK